MECKCRKTGKGVMSVYKILTNILARSMTQAFLVASTVGRNTVKHDIHILGWPEAMFCK